MHDDDDASGPVVVCSQACRDSKNATGIDSTEIPTPTDTPPPTPTTTDTPPPAPTPPWQNPRDGPFVNCQEGFLCESCYDAWIHDRDAGEGCGADLPLRDTPPTKKHKSDICDSVNV